MGRKLFFQMLLLRVSRMILALSNNLFSRIALSIGTGCARLFRPMYAWANMGHPARVADPAWLRCDQSER
jgi:hypothetical protein